MTANRRYTLTTGGNDWHPRTYAAAVWRGGRWSAVALLLLVAAASVG